MFRSPMHQKSLFHSKNNILSMARSFNSSCIYLKWSPLNNCLNFVNSDRPQQDMKIWPFVYQLNSAICRTGASLSDTKGIVSKKFPGGQALRPQFLLALLTAPPISKSFRWDYGIHTNSRIGKEPLNSTHIKFDVKPIPRICQGLSFYIQNNSF